MTSAWWTSRSIIAAATVSPKTSPQRAKSLLLAMQNSHATSDDELHPLREVARWMWAGDDDGQSVMTVIVANPAHATYINTFRCHPLSQDEIMAISIDIVERVAESFPGFISAAGHRSSDGTRVFNYLQWESAEHLAAMQRSPACRRSPAGSPD